MSNTELINLLNDVISCMQNQFSYMTHLGIVTSELEKNYCDIQTKISNFEDSRIKIASVDVQKCTDENNDSLFGSIGMCVEESDVGQQQSGSPVILTVTKYDDEHFSESDSDHDDIDSNSDSVELAPCETGSLADEESLLSHQTKQGKIKGTFFEQFKTGSSDKPYQCYICHKLFLHLQSFKSHIHIRELIGKPNFTCGVCHKTVTHKNTFIVHMRSHTGEKPYECETCKKTFVTQDSIRKHLLIHKGLKPYLCSVCGMSFTQSSSLKGHMRRHTGEKPYKCDTCGATFRTKSNLHDHNLRKHLKIMPHICEICSSGFVSKAHLFAHIRTHTGERPFDCDICSCKFATFQHLKRHELTHKHKMQEKCTFSENAKVQMQTNNQ